MLKLGKQVKLVYFEVLGSAMPWRGLFTHLFSSHAFKFQENTKHDEILLSGIFGGGHDWV